MGEIPAELLATVNLLADATHAHQSGRYGVAIEKTDHALTQLDRQGLRIGSFRAQVLQLRAASLLEEGDLDDALDSCGRAVAALVASFQPGVKPTEDACAVLGTTLSTTAQIHRTQGLFGKAQAAYQEAITILRECPGEHLAMALSNLGALASHMADPDLARGCYEESLAVVEAHCPESPSRAQISLNLGGAQIDAREFGEARTHLDRALEMFEERGSEKGRAQTLIALSGLDAGEDKLDAAKEKATEAERLAASLSPGSELHVAALLQLLKLDPASEAGQGELLAAQQALSRRTATSRDAILVAVTLARAYLLGDDIAAARMAADDAVAAAGHLRQNAPPGLGRGRITTATSQAYDALAEVAVEEGNEERLVEALELRQARRLLDTIGAGRIAPPTEPADQDLQAQRRDAKRTLQHAHWADDEIASGVHTPLTFAEVRDAAAKARWIVQQVDARLGDRDATPQLMDFGTIRERLKPRQAIIHCLTTENIAAAVTVTQDLAAVNRVGYSAPHLSGSIETIREAIRLGEDAGRNLEALSEALLANLPDDIEDVIVVADGPLHALPWALLADESRGGPLGITRRLSHAASATTWFAIADREPQQFERDVLLVGDPAYTERQFPDPYHRRLEGTAQEVAALQTLMAATELVREDAVESKVLREFPRHRLVHFACHGLADHSDGLQSGLILRPPGDDDDGVFDELLQAWELEDLDLPCELVVLSACSTGEGSLQPGEGLLGLVHALHVAGVRQVVASLWAVNDIRTADVMVTLHEQLQAGRSLADAMQETRRIHASLAPRHWAAWAVYGPPAPTTSGTA